MMPGLLKSGEIPGDFGLWQGRMPQVVGDEQGDKIEHKQEETGGNKEQGVHGVFEEKEDIYEDCCAEDNEGDPPRCTRCIQAAGGAPAPSWISAQSVLCRA